METPASLDGSHENQHIRLACQACQRKKIKCDRTFPCGQCTRSNLHCVASQRKPRTRHAGKRAVDSELRNRITKLESLVESLSGEVGLQDDSLDNGHGQEQEQEHDQEQEQSPASAEATSPAVGKYIGNQFWSSLTTEVQALRDALEDDQHDDGPEQSNSTTSSGRPDANAQEYDLIMCPPGAIFVMPGALNEPSPQVAAALYGAFIENVVPILRIFHVPSLRRFLSQGAPYLGVDANATPCKALKAAIWFAAVNTVSDVECQSRFGQRKSDMLQQYRRWVEVRLAQADLMNTTEMATMHAFITYLVILRITDMSRRVWTLTAIAVRIATAMELQFEVPGKTPFETEMRRRLWHETRFVDIFSAQDRGSPTLISEGTYKTPLPSNVNDSEIDEDSIVVPHHETGLTDMAFALLAFEATTCTHRLNWPEGYNGDTWQRRMEIAENFQKRVQEKFFQHCDMTIPFHRLIHDVGRSMCAGMFLRAVRPLQRHLASSTSPPRIDSPYVLQIAVDALRHNEKVGEDPEAEKWRWMVWVHWQPLAVALAGLCSIRGAMLADAAWPYVERAYTRISRNVADTRNGMLWRPIEKLYRKASAFRDGGRRESAPMQNRVPPSSGNTQQQPQQPQRQLPPFQLSPAYPPPAQQPQQIHQRPVGSVPLDPILSGPMDFGDVNVNDAMAGMNFNPSDDMSWLDWEHIMDDLAEMPPMNINMGDLSQPAMVPNGADWPCPLHQDLV